MLAPKGDWAAGRESLILEDWPNSAGQKSFRMATIYAFYACNVIVFMGLEGKWQGGAILFLFLHFSGPALRVLGATKGTWRERREELRRWHSTSFFNCAPNTGNSKQKTACL